MFIVLDSSVVQVSDVTSGQEINCQSRLLPNRVLVAWGIQENVLGANFLQVHLTLHMLASRLLVLKAPCNFFLREWPCEY